MVGRRPNAARIPAALALLLIGVAALVLPGGGRAFFADPGGSLESASSRIRLDASSPNALVLQTSTYRLTLAKRNGGLIELLDKASGLRLVKATNGCQWGAVAADDPTYIGGCRFQPNEAARFSYAWDPGSTTLTLTYAADPSMPRPVGAVVTIRAAQSSFDVQLTLDNETSKVLTGVSFPVDLIEDENLVEAGYGPNFLPGVRFLPSFFQRIDDSVETYPSRWAFADYAALDLGGSHLSLYAVNPSGPIAPAKIGFVHQSSGPCSASSFCLVHNLQTWIVPGASWTSPVMRIRVGQPVEETILGYRTDNGIDAYPSVSDKAGGNLSTLVRAPLIKADLEKGVPPFSEWAPFLARLPSPALLHPVAFGPGGFDETDPDVLPPDTRFGTTETFRAIVQAANARGQLVMPYLNVSWWNPQSPTIRDLPKTVDTTSISMQASDGKAVTEQFSGNDGFIVSPSSPYVRQRIGEELQRWQTQVPANCLFFDQIGARPWRLDFNPAAPTPLAYDDGWLSLMAPFRSRCLMVEDGWDRLASPFVGFAGGLQLMQREFDWLDDQWGKGTWETYPLADWLVHDKVLLYQHDLYDDTMTTDREILTWNLAYGFMLSYAWDQRYDTLSSPWLELAGDFQRALGPHYAGVALTSYRRVGDGVTETRFGDFSVVANWSATAPYSTDGYGVAPGGFVARAGDGSVLAGVFTDTFGGSALSPGVHYVVVERSGGAVGVRQPIGADTQLAVDPPPGWTAGQPIRVTALAAGGSPIADVPGELRGSRYAFTYQSALNGTRVDAYRLTAG